MTTVYVSDVLEDAFPFLSPYLKRSKSEIKGVLSGMVFDEESEGIVSEYSSKAMGTLVYSLANLAFSFASGRDPDDAEREVILGISLVSLSSSLFDDALDNKIDRSRRAYLVSLADICSSRGLAMIHEAEVDSGLKSDVLGVVQDFQMRSWKANLMDQKNRWPTKRTCETALDTIGLPVEAGTRVGALLASGDPDYYSDLGRVVGQAVALLDDILDTELDIRQGFFSRYPLFFALKTDPSIKRLLENDKVSQAFHKLKNTGTIKRCRNLLEEKLEKLEKYDLSIRLKCDVTV